MVLQRWGSFADVRRMDADMDRIWRHTFRPFHTWHRSTSGDGRPAVDIYRDEDNLVVCLPNGFTIRQHSTWPPGLPPLPMGED